MTEFKEMGDNAVLEEIGRRLGQRRIALGLTQAKLALEAGVSKRTIERIESGAVTQTRNLIRILRVLGLLPGFDHLVPEAGPSPMDLLKLKGKARKRAASKRSANPSDDEWSWGDDA